jgi:hypothetical protein
MKTALTRAVKHGSRTVAGMVPVAVLLRLGMPALAALVFLAVLMVGVTCWIISSDARTGRVNRMMLARQGDARCLETGAAAAFSPTSRPRRRTTRSGSDTTKASAGQPPRDLDPPQDKTVVSAATNLSEITDRYL